MLGGVHAGKRNDAAASFCGKLLGNAKFLDSANVEMLWMAAVDWNRSNTPPLPESELRRTFESILQREKRKRRETYNPTDMGNAERLVSRYASDIRYCYDFKKWLIWDGTRWCCDNTGRIERYPRLATTAQIATRGRSWEALLDWTSPPFQRDQDPESFAVTAAAFFNAVRPLTKVLAAVQTESRT